MTQAEVEPGVEFPVRLPGIGLAGRHEPRSPELYFGTNYRRLQAVNARWDPRDVVRHALSVRPQ